MTHLLVFSYGKLDLEGMHNQCRELQKNPKRERKRPERERERERDGEVTLDEWPCGPGIYIQLQCPPKCLLVYERRGLIYARTIDL